LGLLNDEIVKRENNFSKKARSKSARSVPMERESFWERAWHPIVSLKAELLVCACRSEA